MHYSEANLWKTEFTYDGKGRCRIRKEYSCSNGNWIPKSEVRYVYDGNLVVQERDIFNTPLVNYTRGRDLSGGIFGAGGIGGLLARTESQGDTQGVIYNTAYYHADGNGNVTVMLNTNQTIVAKYIFDPSGNIISAIGPLAEANLYRFASKELHVASGLISFLRRFYDPALQRWINRDPLQERAGVNLFRYSKNHPTGTVDPWGAMAVSSTIAISSVPSKAIADPTVSGVGPGMPGIAKSPGLSEIPLGPVFPVPKPSKWTWQHIIDGWLTFNFTPIPGGFKLGDNIPIVGNANGQPGGNNNNNNGIVVNILWAVAHQINQTTLNPPNVNAVVGVNVAVGNNVKAGVNFEHDAYDIDFNDPQNHVNFGVEVEYGRFKFGVGVTPFHQGGPQGNVKAGYRF